MTDIRYWICAVVRGGSFTQYTRIHRVITLNCHTSRTGDNRWRCILYCNCLYTVTRITAIVNGCPRPLDRVGIRARAVYPYISMNDIRYRIRATIRGGSFAQSTTTHLNITLNRYTTRNT